MKGLVYSKVIQFCKNNGLLPQIPFPLKYPKNNNLPTLYQISSGLYLKFLLPLKISSFKIHRWLQHDNAGNLAGSWSQFGSRHLSECVPSSESYSYAALSCWCCPFLLMLPASPAPALHPSSCWLTNVSVGLAEQHWAAQRQSPALPPPLTPGRDPGLVVWPQYFHGLLARNTEAPNQASNRKSEEGASLCVPSI